jgi:hypothetical protein
VLDSVEHLDKMGATVLGAVLLRSPRSTGRGRASIVAAEGKVQLERRPAAALTAGDTAPETDPEAGVSDRSAVEEASRSVPGR